MKNAINVVKIILSVLELVNKYKMSKNAAAATTAGQMGINLSEVLEVVAKYFKKKDWMEQFNF